MPKMETNPSTGVTMNFIHVAMMGTTTSVMVGRASWRDYEVLGCPTIREVWGVTRVERIAGQTTRGGI